jgi:calcium-dependent protein kinase
LHKACFLNGGIQIVTKEQRAQLDKVWSDLDADGDGQLSKKELKQWFNSQGQMLDDSKFD